MMATEQNCYQTWPHKFQPDTWWKFQYDTVNDISIFFWICNNIESVDVIKFENSNVYINSCFVEVFQSIDLS